MTFLNCIKRFEIQNSKRFQSGKGQQAIAKIDSWHVIRGSSRRRQHECQEPVQKQIYTALFCSKNEGKKQGNENNC